MNRRRLYIIILVALCGCNTNVHDKDEQLINNDVVVQEDTDANRNYTFFQNWEIDDANHPQRKDLYDRTDSGVYNYPGLTFLNDSFLVENPRGEIRHGRFSVSDSLITASFIDGGKATYQIKEIHPKEMVLERTEKGKKTFLYLNGDGVTYRNGRSNPYHPLFNKWRIKPLEPESIALIRQRAKNFVQFCIIFFKDNFMRRGSAEIDFQGIPCCFKWYQGGIFIQSEKNLDRKFIECFYDKEEALQARKMLEDVLLKKYNWEKNESNWLKQTSAVLQQIHDNL